MSYMLHDMRQKGFTLIEALVVVGIIALVLPAVFAIIFAIVREQAKVYALKQVKREGDFVISSMENTIRGYAAGIYNSQSLNQEECNPNALGQQNPYPTTLGDNGNAFYFKDYNGNWLHYYLNGNSIASSSAVFSPTNITTSQIRVSSFQLQCNRTAQFSTPIITVSFQIALPSSSFQENFAQLQYQTQIKMKNY